MAEQRRHQYQQHQEHRQEVPGLQPDHPHHAHGGVGDIHGGHGAGDVHHAEGPQPGGGQRTQAAFFMHRQRRAEQQHRRAQDIQQRDGQVQRPEHTQLADEEFVLVQGTEQHRDIPQRIGQDESQLRQLLHPFDHPLDGAIIVPERHPVPLDEPGDHHRPDQTGQRHLPFFPAGLPGPAGQNQRQHDPQQVDIGLGHVHEHKGREKGVYVPVPDLVPAVVAGYQVVKSQQSGIVA